MGVVTDGSTHYQRQVGAGEYGLEHNWTPVFKRRVLWMDRDNKT